MTDAKDARIRDATDLRIRDATEADLPGLVALLADDHLGQARERPGDPAYLRAFRAMAAQDGNHLFAGELDGVLVACAQLVFQPGLARTGTVRAVIEGVRVGQAWRNRGLGGALIRFCIARARDGGAGLVQLTSDMSRTDAHRFYARLGFTTTSVGMKLTLA